MQNFSSAARTTPNYVAPNNGNWREIAVAPSSNVNIVDDKRKRRSHEALVDMGGTNRTLCSPQRCVREETQIKMPLYLGRKSVAWYIPINAQNICSIR